MTLMALVQACAASLAEAGVSFGHGTTNALDEAAWLVLWQLGLPLDTLLDGDDSVADTPVAADKQALVQALVAERISSRKPAAYLTHEAWLQGFAFYVDERVIVPRSLIAELLVDGGALALELQHAEALILERINGHFGYRAVTRLRLIQRPMPERLRLPRANPVPDAPADPLLTDRLAVIADDDLRAALARLGQAVRTRDAGRAAKKA